MFMYIEHPWTIGMYMFSWAVILTVVGVTSLTFTLTISVIFGFICNGYSSEKGNVWLVPYLKNTRNLYSILLLICILHVFLGILSILFNGVLFGGLATLVVLASALCILLYITFTFPNMLDTRPRSYLDL